MIACIYIILISCALGAIRALILGLGVEQAIWSGNAILSLILLEIASKK